MRECLFTLCIVVGLIALFVAPVTALLPEKNPLPKGQGFDATWNMLVDLQAQIESLAARLSEAEEAVEEAVEEAAIGDEALQAAMEAGDAALQAQLDDIQLIPGEKGDKGDQGEPGAPGLACWDTYESDPACDPQLEDMNKDGVCDVLDCQGPPGESGDCSGCEILVANEKEERERAISTEREDRQNTDTGVLIKSRLHRWQWMAEDGEQISYPLGYEMTECMLIVSPAYSKFRYNPDKPADITQISVANLADDNTHWDIVARTYVDYGNKDCKCGWKWYGPIPVWECETCPDFEVYHDKVFYWRICQKSADDV